jgi:flagellar hook-associated protein 1 FlgK
MSSFSALEIGKRALLAQQFGINVTNNNIANVNTPNYSRRTPTFVETEPTGKTLGQYSGTGVTVGDLTNYRQELLDKELRTATSQNKGYEIDQNIYQQIDAVLAEPSDNGLNELTTKFLSTFNQLALTPDDVALRQSLLEQANTLTAQFNSTANGLAQIREDAKQSLSQVVDQANSLIKDIASLNTSIVNSKPNTNSDSQTLIDQREGKIEQLSQLFGINVTYNQDNTANIFINGTNIVTGSVGSQIKMNETINNVTGEKTLQLLKVNTDNQSTTLLNPDVGQAANYLKYYNVLLDDKESSSSFSVAKNLDDFANALAQSINSKVITGYGLDDKQSTPPGRNFFDPSAGFISASQIKVSADIANTPKAIPLSSKPNEPGNNDIALQLGRIAQDQSFLNGQTPTEYYANFLGKLSYATSEAINGYNTTNLVQQQLQNQRDSTIGVNLDEEAISLIKYQKAFEAASRIVNTSNELLTTIVNLGK